MTPFRLPSAPEQSNGLLGLGEAQAGGWQVTFVGVHALRAPTKVEPSAHVPASDTGSVGSAQPQPG